MGLLYVYFLATNIARIKQCYRLCRVNKSPKPCNMVLTPDTSGGWREAHASVREYVERPARPAVDAAYLHQVCSPQNSPQGAEPELDYLRITCVFRWGAPSIGRSPLCRRFATLRRSVQFTLCQPVVRDFCQKAMRSNVTKGGGPNLSEVAIVLVML